MIAFLISALSLALAQSGKTTETEFPTFTVCELLSQRLDYDGKLVRIRTRVSSNSEGVWFPGDDCPGVVNTDGYVWPSMISMSDASPDMDLNHRIHPVNFNSDYEGKKKLWPKLLRLGRKAPNDCIIWTYTGLFETRKEYTKVSYTNAPSVYIGFGHLGAAPAQLLWKTAEDVNVAPNCRPKTKR